MTKVSLVALAIAAVFAQGRTGPRSPVLKTLQAEIPHFSQTYVSTLRVLGWDQPADDLATVVSYTYNLVTDVGTLAESSPVPLVHSCGSTPNPFPCEATFMFPPSGQTVGAHTLTVTVMNDTGSSTGAMAYVVDPDPQVDPCVAVPLVATVTRWPSNPSAGNGRYFANFTLVSAVFLWNPQRFVATDTRGCSVTVTR